MSTVTSFEPTNLKQIRADIDTALASVHAKYGIKISIGKISYSANQFTFKGSAVTNSAASSASGDVLEGDAKWASNFLKTYFLYGIEKEDLGKTFTLKNSKYTIVGAMGSKASRAEIICKKEGNKSFIRLDAIVVKTALAA
jgi:hypothetical protein